MNEAVTQQVIFKKISGPSVETFYNAVRSIVETLGIDEHFFGESCLIKINAMSREVLPGRNTSPWVLEAILRYMTMKFPAARFMVGDSDCAAYHQFQEACSRWRYNEIAHRYGAKIANLSQDESVRIHTGNPLCPVLEFPKIAAQVDSIINVPVMKTHVLSGISCCLKSFFGFLPRYRYQYHINISEVIAEINKHITKPVLNIVDGTVGMEGGGPKTGHPKVCSVLFGGIDRVAVDAAVLRYMGFDPAIALHVGLSAKNGVGSTDFQIRGDAFETNRFEPPVLGRDLVSYAEKMLRNIPFVGRLLYAPAIAYVLAWIGLAYNETVWFRIFGRRYIKEVQQNKAYREEFHDMTNN